MASRSFLLCWHSSFSIALAVAALLTTAACSPGFQISGLSPLPGASSGLSSADREQLMGKSLYDSKCASCHGPIETSGKLKASVSDISRALETRQEMASLKGSLTPDQIRTIALALNGDGPIPVCDAAPDVGRVTMHRLNNAEYDNTLRDLLGITYRPSQDATFPRDEFSDNFNNNAKVLGVTTAHLSKYLAAAEKAVDSAFANATAKAKLVPCNLTQDACVTQVLTSFLTRAFRRPPLAAELTQYRNLVQVARTEGDSAEVGVKVAMAGALVSPAFLYRAPQHSAPNDPNATRDLSAYELATRMSYFIWSSMPDDALFEAARMDALKTPDQISAQARRMLKDPKAAGLIDNFASQWIRLNDLDAVAPSTSLFPTFTAQLKEDLKTETRLMLKDIFDRDASFFELLHAEYSYLNSRLGEHYGIGGIVGTDFRKVSLAGQGRAGVVTHGSLMAINANPDRTSIVKRGKWVLDNLLCSSPPPPPPEVLGSLPTNSGNLTMRQRMEAHRANPTCYSCHAQMDPIGFALENFDPLGRYRTSDGNGPVDNLGEFPDGRRFSGAREMASVVSEDRRFKLCVAEKIFSYSLGRNPETYDRCTVNRIGLAAVAKDKPMSAVVLEMINSDTFRKHRGDGGKR